MKNLLPIIFCLLSVPVFAQQLPETGLYRVRITGPGGSTVAEIKPSSKPVVKSALYYYWYDADTIHCTQGGFSGKLLNGAYTTFYPDKNLSEQGSFKMGLKNGAWKKWNDDGTLASTTCWRLGVEVSCEKRPVWEKLKIWKRKKNRPSKDTVTRSVNKG